MKVNSRSRLYQRANDLTIHGINHVLNSRNGTRKVFWIITIVLSLGFLAIYGHEKVRYYFSYPTTVLVDLKMQVEKVRFPAVTVCSPLHLNQSKLDQLPQLHETFGYNPDERTVKDITRYGGSWIEFKAMMISLIQLPASDLDELMPKPHEVVVRCLWNIFANCTLENFISSHYDFMFGRCFTFNSIDLVNPSASVNCPGKYCSVILELFVDTSGERFLAGASVERSELRGLHVKVTQPDRPPGGHADAGFLIPTEQVTSVAVRRKHVLRMPRPYATMCIHGNDSRARTLDAHMHGRRGKEYYRDSCLATCLIKRQIQRCGCGIWNLDLAQDIDNVPALADLGPSVSKKMCTANDSRALHCLVVEYQEHVKSGGHYCDCPVRCDEDIYQMRISSATWQPSWHTLHAFRDANPAWERVSDQDVKAGMAKLEVFYETMAYDIVHHLEAYNSYDLLADIGGLIGLFIGFSLITLIEIGELCWDITASCLGISMRARVRRASVAAGIKEGMNSLSLMKSKYSKDPPLAPVN